VGAAEGGGRGAGDGIGLRVAAQVAQGHGRLAARRGDGASDAGRLLLAPAVDHDCNPFGGQRFGDGLADAAAAARDQRPLALQLQIPGDLASWKEIALKDYTGETQNPYTSPGGKSEERVV